MIRGLDQRIACSTDIASCDRLTHDSNFGIRKTSSPRRLPQKHQTYLREVPSGDLTPAVRELSVHSSVPMLKNPRRTLTG